MTNITDLVVPTDAFVQQGFDQRSDALESKRLKNRTALMQIYNEAASNGVQLSLEDMAKQAQSLLGPAAWLYSTAPSVDVMNVMQQSQNAAARTNAEKMRRDQFANDINETKSMEGFIADLSMTGKTADEIHAEGFNQFGDRFAKIAPTVSRIMDKATYAGMQEGINTAKSMNLMQDDAEEFIAQNKSHLPDPVQQGIRKTAQSNQSQAEVQIMSSAAQLAGQGGWEGTAADADNIRNLITSRYPSMKPETVETIYKKAMEAAKVAAGTKLQADDNTSAMKARDLMAAKGPEMQIATINQYTQDLVQRDQKAQAFIQRGAGALVMQEKIRQDIIGNKKTGEKPLLEQATERQQALSIVDTYKIEDVGALVEAVKSGDPKVLKRYTAGLQTLAGYQDRVNTAAMLTTAPVSTPAEFWMRGSQLGAGDNEVLNTGKLYKQDLDAARKGLASSSDSSYGAKSVVGDMLDLTGVPAFRGQGDKWSGTNDNKMGQASLQAAETRLNGLVSTTVNHIKALREAASINQSFSATPDQVKNEEWHLAFKTAKTFLRGAGLDSNTDAFMEQATKIADDVLRAAGSPMQINKRKTPVDMMNDYITNQTSGLGVRRDSMVPPGSIQPNQRAGYANGAAPPPF